MKKKIEFASHPANLMLVRQWVRRLLQHGSFTAREIDLMVLGVDEACTNIIRHAYRLADDKLISLAVETGQGGTIRFRLRDYGERLEVGTFQPRALEHLRPGGLGVHLIQHAFDQVDYLHKRKGTLLVLTKLKRKEVSLVPGFATG
jgi:anti-sigma regulatory factor (Ser/Thr protein kinase)